MIFGIFEKDVIYTLPALTGFLFALGGSGALIFRKYGVPMAITVYAIGYGVRGWKLLVLILGLLAIIGWGPSYGDDYVEKLGKFYWFYIFILGSLFGLCQLGLAFHAGRWLPYILWSLVCGAVFLSALYASKNFGLPHKVFEIITGGVIGLVSVFLTKKPPNS